MKASDKRKQWLLEKYVSYFFIYSFIGWVFEIIITLFQMKKFVDCGILNIPILPIYGFGAVIISLIFKHDDYEWFLVALIGGAVATGLELFTSYIMDFIFEVKYWDYSDLKWNFEGRISLITSGVFMIGSVLIVKIINPVIERKLRRFKYKISFELILSALMIITFLDFIKVLINII